MSSNVAPTDLGGGDPTQKRRRFFNSGLMPGLRGRLLLAVVIATALFCLADWVLVQDFGFLGGLGTDPNSMIPLLLLVLAGYLAVARIAPVAEPAEAAEQAVAAESQPASWRVQVRPATLASRLASMSATGILAAWAALLVLIDLKAAAEHGLIEQPEQDF